MKMTLKLLIMGMMGTLLLPVAWAEGKQKMVLDRVIFQATADQWVTTETAKVMITVNATLEAEDLAQARNEILNNLNRIAKAEWQITQFDRSQDSSGLEKLYALAEARVNEKGLTQLHKQAENVSKPGATYQVSQIDFTPSMQEMNEGKQQVRQAIYQQVQQEMNRLNKLFSEQSYTVHSIDFVTGIVPMPTARYQAESVMAGVAPAVSVGNQIIKTATIVAASTRESQYDVD